ncbi:MAG: endonuclease [Acidobacteriales bacterium]|nr:endonuclease [Terriglobales bacterium]
MSSDQESVQERSEAARLRLKILDRDNWRCQFCGARSNLQIHHVLFRSHGGPDSEDNLITACATCHHQVHLGKRRIR